MSGARFCQASRFECPCAICASEATQIATPLGERAIPQIAPGDVVWGTRGAALVPVRVVRIARTRVWHHSMVRVSLANGRVVEMSAGHPTLDGRPFGELGEGDAIGGAAIVAVERVPYAGEYTYDLLTDGEGGGYVAEGVLVGSTLWDAREVH